MFVRNFFFLLLFVFIITSCNNDEYHPDLLKPKTKNNYGEILFAIDKKYWKTDLGKVIKNSFEKLEKTTPLPFEKQYNIDFVVPDKILKNLKNNNCFVFVDVKHYYPSKTIPITKRNLWSRNQIIVELKFNSVESAIHYFKTASNELKSIVNEFNFQKIANNWSFSNSLSSELLNQNNLKFRAPRTFKINVKKKDFCWFSDLEIKKDQNGSHEVQKGIVVYQNPYINENQFNQNYILKLKDSIGEKYLKGKKKKSYMITSKNDISEISDTSIYINNKYVKLIKGCWRMKNDKMGGPFISYSWLNNSNIITVEGYVYAPNFKKLNYLRELEAIIISGI
tara:strand:- start:1126 stop:2136 length:1011 start_codon:yes stop_codon:yes gene_type:complete